MASSDPSLISMDVMDVMHTMKVPYMKYTESPPKQCLHARTWFLFSLAISACDSLLAFASTHNADHKTNESKICQFVSSRGNEYFCEIDEEYLTDRFNLTGLNTEVHYYQHALDLVNDVFDLDCEDEMREAIEKSARHLYGLVHARYIVTTRGLAKMVCPRPLSEIYPYPNPQPQP
jgi:Casein kinase II regulatory subunit